jgi:hypothetical protein
VQPAEARRVLGVAETAGWPEVRAAYRRLIRVVHPDAARGSSRERSPESGHLQAALLNEAYAVLVRAQRDRTAMATTATPRSATPDPPDPTDLPDVAAGHRSAARVHRGGLHVPWSVPEAFVRVLAAAEDLGEVTFAERSSAILEVVLRVEGETCSFVASFHPRRGGTEVWCTLEALERVATLDPAPVVRQLAALLAS